MQRSAAPTAVVRRPPFRAAPEFSMETIAARISRSVIRKALRHHAGHHSSRLRASVPLPSCRLACCWLRARGLKQAATIAVLVGVLGDTQSRRHVRFAADKREAGFVLTRLERSSSCHSSGADLRSAVTCVCSRIT